MAVAAAAGPRREGFDWTRAYFNDAAARVAPSVFDDRDGIEDGPANIPLPGMLPGIGSGSVDRLRKLPLTVRDDDLGAGLEISFVPKCGFVVEAIAEVPGQPGLREGDIILNIGGQSLALETEEEADEVLASQLLDGVELIVTQDPTAALDPLAALPSTSLAADSHVEAVAQSCEVADMPTTSLAATPGSTSLAPPNSSSFFDFDELEDSADAATLPVTSLAATFTEAPVAPQCAESGENPAGEDQAAENEASPAPGALESMSVAALRQELAQRGLSAEGCLEKSDLVNRIIDATSAAVDTAVAQEAERPREADASGEVHDDASSASEKTMPLQRWLEADPESKSTRTDIGVADEGPAGYKIEDGIVESQPDASDSARAPPDEVANAVEESDDGIHVLPDDLKSTLSNTLLSLSSSLGTAGLPARDELPVQDGHLHDDEGTEPNCEAAEEASKADCEIWSHAPTHQALEDECTAGGSSWAHEDVGELPERTRSRDSPSELPLPKALVGTEASRSDDPWVDDDPWKRGAAERGRKVASTSARATSAATSPTSAVASPHAAAKSRFSQKVSVAPAAESSDYGLALVPLRDAAATTVATSCTSNSRRPAVATAAMPMATMALEGTESAGLAQCKVQDLWGWMVEMSLEEYFERATQWCVEMGAATLEEIAENIEDFGDDVNLKPIEKQRVQKWAAQVLMRSGAVGSGSNGWVVEADFSRGTSSTGWGGGASGWGSSSASGWGGGASGWILEGEADADMDVVVDSGLESGANYSYQSAAESSSQGSGVHIYTARSIRLSMDSRGNTGLGLEWDEEWGIRVRSVDPLPGQPGLRVGDYIVAIDGCSLRHRPHEECDSVFAERLQDGACLSVVSPAEQEVSPHWQLATRSAAPARHSDNAGRAKGCHVGRSAAPLQMRLSRAPSQADGQHGWRLGKGRRAPPLSRGGYNPDNMWRRFRNGGPPW